MASWSNEQSSPRDLSGRRIGTEEIVTIGALAFGALAGTGIAIGAAHEKDQGAKFAQTPIAKIEHAPHREYTVKSGDTEWRIATKAYPGSDPRLVL